MKLLFVKILDGSIFHYLNVSNLLGFVISYQYDFIRVRLMLKTPASLSTIEFLYTIPWTERFFTDFRKQNVSSEI